MCSHLLKYSHFLINGAKLDIGMKLENENRCEGNNVLSLLDKLILKSYCSTLLYYVFYAAFLLNNSSSSHILSTSHGQGMLWVMRTQKHRRGAVLAYIKYPLF